MDESQTFESTQYSAPSPDGQYIASITSSHLYVQWAKSLAPAFTFALDTKSVISPTTVIQWSSSSKHIILLLAEIVHIFSLLDSALKIRISNGSGGLGKIVAADVFGGSDGSEQALVVWEFGRTSFCDLGSGRITEIGEAKMGGRGNLWTIRKQGGKTEVLAILSRIAAQDVLSLYLASSVTPFRSMTVPSTDAQSIAWSDCGQWLAILDSTLATPSVHIYTADGYLFKSYAATMTDDEPLGLGYRNLSWTPDALILATDQTITTLDTRTFSHKATLTLSDLLAPTSLTSAYQETITSTGARSYTYQTGSSLPRHSSKANISDLRASSTGTYLSTRDESSSPSTITIWALGPNDAHTVVQQHAAVRKVLWHPRRASLILILSEDASVYIWDVSSGESPIYIPHSFTTRTDVGRVEARWIASPSAAEEKLGILITSRRSGWQVVWPEGREKSQEEGIMTPAKGEASEDSLFDILTGRTPLPALRVTGTEDGDEPTRTGEGLDDTFREKKQQVQSQNQEQVVLKDFEDDSEIF